MRRGDNKEQLLLTFAPAEILPKGDGSYVVRPGKPVARVTPRQFGQEVGVSADTVYRRIQDGTIPDRFVEYSGKRKIYLVSEAVAWWRDYWKGERGG